MVYHVFFPGQVLNFNLVILYRQNPCGKFRVDKVTCLKEFQGRVVHLIYNICTLQIYSKLLQSSRNGEKFVFRCEVCQFWTFQNSAGHTSYFFLLFIVELIQKRTQSISNLISFQIIFLIWVWNRTVVLCFGKIPVFPGPSSTVRPFLSFSEGPPFPRHVPSQLLHVFGWGKVGNALYLVCIGFDSFVC